MATMLLPHVGLIGTDVLHQVACSAAVCHDEFRPTCIVGPEVAAGGAQSPTI
jgi:hypothetical protein